MRARWRGSQAEARQLPQAVTDPAERRRRRCKPTKSGAQQQTANSRGLRRNAHAFLCRAFAPLMHLLQSAAGEVGSPFDAAHLAQPHRARRVLRLRVQALAVLGTEATCSSPYRAFVASGCECTGDCCCCGGLATAGAHPTQPVQTRSRSLRGGAGGASWAGAKPHRAGHRAGGG